MNIRLPNVLSDITGKSGTAIIKAILSGERDAHKLAQLADRRVKSDQATIVKALTGFWRADHLFELKQLLLYNYFAFEFEFPLEFTLSFQLHKTSI